VVRAAPVAPDRRPALVPAPGRPVVGEKHADVVVLGRAAVEPLAPSTARSGLSSWVRVHRLSLTIVAGLLLAVGLVHWTGYDRFPGRINDDEGTYVAQAFAVQYWHALAHYTYWYDHPPVGWITIAAYTWTTHAFERLPTAVSAGREAMVWASLVSAAMIFLLARRLGFHRVAAAAAVLAFGLSPLAVEFQRMVFLDNLAVMWTLAALALAASPRKSLAAAAGSATCFAMAVLSKETTAVLLPALFVLLWQHTSPRTRQYRIPLFLALLGALVFFYPLYAILKNELLEGPGHVSLVWAVKWQLFDRIPSGSLLDATSRTHAVTRSWLEHDPWLLGSGVLLTPLGLVFRRIRALALALAIQVAIMCRNGFLPFAYVLAMLPFAALVVAGVADQLCQGYTKGRRLRRPERLQKLHAAGRTLVKRAGQAVVGVAVVASVVVVTPAWARGLHDEMTQDRSQPAKQAVAYALAHIPERSILLTDDNLWTDLVRHGFDPNPIWFYKLDLDPAIRGKYRNGWRDIDYVVIGYVPPIILQDLPLVTAAIKHSDLVARFGSGETEVTIRKVVKDAPE
jgi:4-amino-4-deoxy-L-arabinose transferase-like glycosyltransferase